jgi:restriction system protein
MPAPQPMPAPRLEPAACRKPPLRRISAARTAAVAALAEIDGRDFERRVAEAFRRQGFRVTGFGAATSGGGRDAGADLGLVKNGERFLVQCRCWRKLEVGVTLIRELCGLLAVQGARGGFVLTCGGFTPEAIELARRSRIRLYAGPQLAQLLELR